MTCSLHLYSMCQNPYKYNSPSWKILKLLSMRWWSSGQLACFLLQWSKFESSEANSFVCKFCFWKCRILTIRGQGLAHILKNSTYQLTLFGVYHPLDPFVGWGKTSCNGLSQIVFKQIERWCYDHQVLAAWAKFWNWKFL